MATELQEKLVPLGAKVIKLRNKDMHWDQIASELGEGQGKVMLAYFHATVEPGDVIKSRTEDELKRKVAKAREEGVSWGVLSARSGMPESWCRAAFKEVSGHDHKGHSIGKGGRVAGSGSKAATNGKAAKAPKATKAADIAAGAKAKAAGKAKATPVKKAAAPKVALADLSLGEIKDKINGKTLSLRDSDDTFEGVTVKSLKNGTLTLTTASGSTQKVAVSNIKAAK